MPYNPTAVMYLKDDNYTGSKPGRDATPEGDLAPDAVIMPSPEPDMDPVGYLKSIKAVRERASVVMKKAELDRLNHFDVDWNKLKKTADYVASIIQRDFAPDYSRIPAHGRWQHFNVGGTERIELLLQTWAAVDRLERTRRLIDLFVVSVLLDAGAGTQWSYKSEESGEVFARSEGLAVASLEMFKQGLFSSNPQNPYQVDAEGLLKVTTESLGRGMQHSEDNPLAGLEGRAALLRRLSQALVTRHYFTSTVSRPGYMLDYLLAHPSTQYTPILTFQIHVIWNILMDGFSEVWPASRTKIEDVSLGDAWPCNALPRAPPAQPWEAIVPFHKLTQWMCYSLLAPITHEMSAKFGGIELLTGLPEYRNGGLLVDTGLLLLRDADRERGLIKATEVARQMRQQNADLMPLFEADDDVIVEWRALTVCLLDRLSREVNKLLGSAYEEPLSLAQILEAGTWKGGREIAATLRPSTKEPPIAIVSDGTVF